MKKCNVCLKEFDLNYFYKNKNNKDGFFKLCIKCHKKNSIEKSYLNRKKSVDFTLIDGEIFKETMVNKNYLVSNFGRAYVKEHFGSRYISGKFLKLTILKTGYPTIQINGKKLLMHRLIAETFLVKQDGKNFVNHKDSNRSNNNLDNLEWVSFNENVSHGVNKDRYANKLKREDVLQIRNSKLKPKVLSEIYKVSDVNIRLILANKIWKHLC